MGCGSGGVFEICAAKQVGRREGVVGCVNICTRAVGDEFLVFCFHACGARCGWVGGL